MCEVPDNRGAATAFRPSCNRHDDRLRADGGGPASEPDRPIFPHRSIQIRVSDRPSAIRCWFSKNVAVGWLGRGHSGVIIGEPNLLGPLPASVDAVSAEDRRLTDQVRTSTSWRKRSRSCMSGWRPS